MTMDGTRALFRRRFTRVNSPRRGMTENRKPIAQKRGESDRVIGRLIASGHRQT
jgi:hypothetical protein